MMPRRSFLEAAVWLAAAGSLAGCSSDGTAGVAYGFGALGGWIPEFDAFMQEAFAMR